MVDLRLLRKKYRALGYPKKVVEALVSLAVTLDRHKLSSEAQETVCNLFSEEGRQQLAELPEAVIAGEWEPFNYGNVKLGDYVRIRPGSYDSPTGKRHNGLVGRLKHMSGHRCLVAYVGERFGDTMRHPMENLDSLRIR